VLIWPEKHFARFHDWNVLRLKRLEETCICGQSIDPRIIDDFDQTVWCSRACFEDVALRCGLIKPNALVYQRDHGVCAMCGADAGAATRALERIRQVDRWDFRLTYAENHERTSAARSAAFLILDAWGVSEETRSLWDADHIVPVIEGGGGCGLSNYRTLCVSCHRGETAQLASRRAERRRAARPLSIQISRAAERVSRPPRTKAVR
jgi:5-methylcytosine-specific restriction protein A